MSLSLGQAFLLISLGVAIYLAYKFHKWFGWHFRGTVVSCLALTLAIYFLLWQLYAVLVWTLIVAGISVVATLIITRRTKRRDG